MSEYHCRSHNPDTVVGCDLNKNSRHVRSGRVGFFNPSLWTLCFTTVRVQVKRIERQHVKQMQQGAWACIFCMSMLVMKA